MCLDNSERLLGCLTAALGFVLFKCHLIAVFSLMQVRGAQTQDGSGVAYGPRVSRCSLSLIQPVHPSKHHFYLQRDFFS